MVENYKDINKKDLTNSPLYPMSLEERGDPFFACDYPFAAFLRRRDADYFLSLKIKDFADNFVLKLSTVALGRVIERVKFLFS